MYNQFKYLPIYFVHIKPIKYIIYKSIISYRWIRYTLAHVYDPIATYVRCIYQFLCRKCDQVVLLFSDSTFLINALGKTTGKSRKSGRKGV